MTRNQLVAAYQSGGIDRRAFIRGLTALGLSTSVATAMADRLRAAPASGGSVARAEEQDDTYSVPTPVPTATPTPTATPPADDPTDETVTTTLPKTGAGDETGGGTGWVKPAALLGAAAAVVAGGFRKLTGKSGTDEA